MRIALSLRRTLPDPWDIVNETYQIGQVVEGTVSNVVDFGAFVVLPDGIEGLLHITEMADGTLTEPHSYLKRGDKVSVKIVRIEPERRRIGFTQQGLNISRPTDEPTGEVEANDSQTYQQGSMSDEAVAGKDELSEAPAEMVFEQEESPAAEIETDEQKTAPVDETEGEAAEAKAPKKKTRKRKTE